MDKASGDPREYPRTFPHTYEYVRVNVSKCIERHPPLEEGSYVELRTAEDSLPLPTMNLMLNVIVSDYHDKLQLASTDLLKSTLTSVCMHSSFSNKSDINSVQGEKSLVHFV